MTGQRPASLTPLRVWCVSDGRAGIERQTLAVADALDEVLAGQRAVEREVIRLTPGPPQLWLPPGLWPMPLAALPAHERARLAHPWPDVWIANGRRSVPYSLRVRGWSGGATRVVQLQDPTVNLRRFDLVVPPRHDGLSGPNVVSTFGAPVWYSAESIAAAQAVHPDLATDKAGGSPCLAVIIGGPSKRHRLGPQRLEAIAGQLGAAASAGAQLWITTSRRTPDWAVERLRALAAQLGARFFASEATDGPNPYLAWLASADAALVTEDSTNMITDAAFFGLPVHLIRLEGGDAKFDGFHRALMEAGRATFEPWSPGALARLAPLRDALAVAQRIAALLERRG